jgi:hypothetical protein
LAPLDTTNFRPNGGDQITGERPIGTSRIMQSSYLLHRICRISHTITGVNSMAVECERTNYLLVLHSSSQRRGSCSLPDNLPRRFLLPYHRHQPNSNPRKRLRHNKPQSPAPSSSKISVSERGSVVASIRRRVHGIFQAPHRHPAHLFRLPVIFCPNAASHSKAQIASGIGPSRARITCDVLLSSHRTDARSEPHRKCRPRSIDTLESSHDGKALANVMDNGLAY